MVSKIWPALSSPPAHTSSAASTQKLPAKTDSRAHSVCSAGRAQVVAPADGVTERPVAGVAALAAARQYRQPAVEPLVDPVGQLGQRQRPQPHGGQLDRQRHAVEPTAQPDHVGPVRVVEREPGQHGGRPEGKQLDGVGRPLSGGVVTGQAEPGEDVAALAGHVQRLAAGGEHRDLARLGDDGLGEERAGVDDVLAGVEDQQHALVAQVREHRLELRAPGLLGQVELPGDSVRQQLGVEQRRTAGQRRRRRGTRPRPAPSRAVPPASYRRRPGRPA